MQENYIQLYDTLVEGFKETHWLRHSFMATKNNKNSKFNQK